MMTNLLPKSALAERPAERVSDNYIFIPTTQIVNDLMKLGWEPHRGVEIKARAEARIGFQKHMIRFRHPDFGVEKVGDCIPEILVTNAHDGYSCFELNAGIFRLVCSNGMVVADTTFNKIRIRHIGYSVAQVEQATYQFAQGLPKIVETVNEYKSIRLDNSRMYEFAVDAVNLRWAEHSPVKPEALLYARRPSDNTNTLWNVLNNVQENLFKGGLRGKSQINDRGKSRKVKTRPIKSLDLELSLNKGLWELAEKYRLN